MVSEQKNPNDNAFIASNNPVSVPSKVILYKFPLITIVAYPHNKLAVVISQEYLVVAFIENTFV